MSEYPKAPYKGADDWARHAAASDARIVELEHLVQRLTMQRDAARKGRNSALERLDDVLSLIRFPEPGRTWWDIAAKAALRG